MLRPGSVRAAVVMVCLSVHFVSAAVVTVTFSGEVTDVVNSDGLLPMPVVAAGDAFTLSYEFDTATGDGEPSVSFGTYALSSIDMVMVNLGTFNAPGEIRVVNDTDYSDAVTGEDFFDVDAYVVGTGFDPISIGLVGSMDMSAILADDQMSVFANDSLPAALPDLSEFETRIVALSYIDDEGRSFFIQADITLLEASGDCPRPCDDGVDCTKDACVGGVCVSTPSDALCDNGNFCDGSETCNGMGGCESGSPPNCNDGNVCTADSCSPDENQCVHVPSDALCDNGRACDGVEACDPDLGCQPGIPLNCNDGVVCTFDSCDEDTDSCVHTPNNAVCDNGDSCDGVEFCEVALGCQAGDPVDCNDGVACTVDTCDETTDACVHTPSDDFCDNGDFCDGGETCGPGGCQLGTPRNCSDGVACTADACDEAADVCVHMPLDSFCDNGDACDGVEHCDAQAGCVLGAPPNCNDGIACTLDACDPSTGDCLHTPSDGFCNNDDFCDGDEVCGPAGCEPGPSRNCNDGVACTIDSCDEAADACVNTPLDAFCDNGDSCDGSESCDPVNGCAPGAPPNCNDGIACTFDTCDPITGDCLHTPSDALCNNGDFCDGDEVCGASGCTAGEPRSCNDSVACTVDACDEKTNACVHLALDAFCDNGEICDGSETCDPLGGCQPGVPPNCNDGVVCTLDSCDPASGACVHTPSDALCDNGRACDGQESCDPLGGCLPGTPLSCNDGVVCTLDSCDEKTDACVYAPQADLCDNGDFCDGQETCDAQAGCQPGTPPNCSDGVACTIDLCDEGTDSCASAPSDGFCNNGDYCDGVETCDPLTGCQPGTPPDCNDGVVCTVDSCNELSDTCSQVLDPDFCDNGDFCDGFETCDPATGCQPGTPPICDDQVACTVDSCDEANDVCASVPQHLLCNDGNSCTNDFCSFSGCVFELTRGAECANAGDCAADELCENCMCVPSMEIIGACCLPPGGGAGRSLPGDDDDDGGELPAGDDDDDGPDGDPPAEPARSDSGDNDDDAAGELPVGDDDDDADLMDSCVPLREDECLDQGGTFLGVGSICRPGICGSDVCEDGKPCALTLKYTGQDCSASDHSQSDSSVACTGDPALAAEVMIVANDDDEAGGGLVWFTGNVLLGDNFVLEAANAGEERLKANTFVHIFDIADGSLLQRVKFHTSCSQPLALGDQFGGVQLVGFVAEGDCQ